MSSTTVRASMVSSWHWRILGFCRQPGPGPQDFVVPRLVMPYQPIGRSEDRRGRAVVFLEPHGILASGQSCLNRRMCEYLVSA